MPFTINSSFDSYILLFSFILFRWYFHVKKEDITNDLAVTFNDYYRANKLEFGDYWVNSFLIRLEIVKWVGTSYRCISLFAFNWLFRGSGVILMAHIYSHQTTCNHIVKRRRLWTCLHCLPFPSPIGPYVGQPYLSLSQ